MHIRELWRYPVKSMAGEQLDVANVTTNGIEGDRTALVVRNGRIITSRSNPRLLAHRACIGPDGEPLVDGLPWNSPAIAQAVIEAAGEGASLIRYAGPERFDILPLLVATDGAIAVFGEDGRRLRPNIVIGGVEGLAEREWEGRQIRVGDVIIQIHDLRGRCVMTTYHPDTQKQDLNVLRRIVSELDGKIALNCSVVAPGTIRIGDTVEFV
ncbi:MAG: MOSC domain-containing protein [Thermoanaerobaculia bacterium]